MNHTYDEKKVGTEEHDAIEETLYPKLSLNHAGERSRAKLITKKPVQGGGEFESRTQYLTEQYAGERIVGLRAWDRDSIDELEPQTLPMPTSIGGSESKGEGKSDDQDRDSKHTAEDKMLTRGDNKY